MTRPNRGRRPLWALTGVLFLAACPKETKCPPQTPCPAPPPAPPPQPVVIDQYATPFAVVPAQLGSTTCTLDGPDAKSWIAVAADRGRDGKPDPTRPPAPRRSGPEDPGICVYKWADPKALPGRDAFRRIKALPDSPIITINQDAVAPAPSPTGPPTGGAGTTASPMGPEIYQPGLKTFNRQARGFEAKQWRLAPERFKSKGNIPVKVAVIDATPIGLAKPDRTQHGFVVSRIIADLFCADPNSQDCSDRVVPYLALPMVSLVEEDFTTGGRFGAFFHISDALQRAISGWVPSKQRLIINLSLGWDAIKTEPDDPSVARVRDLLERASCMGALIVAAAGNSTGTQGPVYPAAFETYKAPDEECVRFKLPARKAKPGVYAPLVHAVGALDGLDQRLMVDRPWGQPRLAAFGLGVSVAGPAGMPYTPPMTGTSMAAAVVSGVAAAVWSVQPKLDAAEVMARVYDGAIPIDSALPPGKKTARHPQRAQTEFCLGQPDGPCREWTVRRVFLCGALAQVMPKGTFQCDMQLSTSIELPAWPDTGTKPPAEAPPPCRVAGCGIPIAPPADQALTGATPHGVANCLFCSLTKGVFGDWDRVQGYPVVPASSSTSLWVKTGFWTSQSYPFPTPTDGVPMDTWLDVPSSTYLAAIYWYYPAAGGGNATEATMLTVGP